MLVTNIKSIIAGLSIILWFKGMYRIFDKYIKDTMINNVLCIFIAVVIMFLNNGSLAILGQVSTPETNKKNIEKYNNFKNY